MGRRRAAPSVWEPGYDYVRRTRALPVNLLFLMPWVMIYQLALMGSQSTVDNAAAAWLRAGIYAFGPRGFVLVSLIACLVLCAAVLVRIREAARDRGVFGGMLLEGLVYGALLGALAQVLAHHLPLRRVVELAHSEGGMDAGPSVLAASGEWLRASVAQLGLAIGAGIFEELVFRAFLLGGLLFIATRGIGADRWTAACLALPVSAYLFSDYHHWGFSGEAYDPAVFAYRFHAGLVLGVVYMTRGLGIAAFAHGFYDVLVLMPRTT